VYAAALTTANQTASNAKTAASSANSTANTASSNATSALNAVNNLQSEIPTKTSELENDSYLLTKDNVIVSSGLNIGDVGSPKVSKYTTTDGDIVLSFDYLKGEKGNDGKAIGIFRSTYSTTLDNIQHWSQKTSDSYTMAQTPVDSSGQPLSVGDAFYASLTCTDDGCEYAILLYVRTAYSAGATSINTKNASGYIKIGSKGADGTNGTNGSNVIAYAECSTAAATTAKTASIVAGTFTLAKGARVTVKFTNANSASNPTLNINSSGAKNIRYCGTNLASSQYWSAGQAVEFVYDGSYWVAVGVIRDNDNQTICYFASNSNNYDYPIALSPARTASGSGNAQMDLGVTLNPSTNVIKGATLDCTSTGIGPIATKTVSGMTKLDFSGSNVDGDNGIAFVSGVLGLVANRTYTVSLVSNFFDWDSIDATNIDNWTLDSVEVTATDLGSINSNLSGAVGLFSDGEAICYDKCSFNSKGEAIFSNNTYIVNLLFPASLEWVKGTTLDITTYSVYIIGEGLSCTLKRYNRIPGEALPPLLLNDYVDDSFLPLEGGTMEGSIITPADDTKGIIPSRDNYGQIGSSDKKFYRMYATTFYGNLSGSASSADSAAKVTATTISSNANYPILTT
jgi:hypothetical protein